MAAILFVVGSTTLTAGNAAVKAALEGAGHTVTLRDDGNATKTVTGYSAAVLASDTASADLVGYLTATEGLVILAHAIWDDAKMYAGATSALTSASVTQATTLSSHSILTSAGLSGTFAAFTTASGARFVDESANLTAGAHTKLLTFNVSPGDNVGAWCYESGALLADGVSTAPGRRVAAPPLSESGANATTSLLNFLVAAVNWAASISAGTPPTLATPTVAQTVTITASASGGTAPYTYSFTQVAGPAVTLSGTGATRTFTRPSPLSESIVIDVTATGADSSSSTTKQATVAAETAAAGASNRKVWNGTAWA